jgi:hypothetical protein
LGGIRLKIIPASLLLAPVIGKRRFQNTLLRYGLKP